MNSDSFESPQALTEVQERLLRKATAVSREELHRINSPDWENQIGWTLFVPQGIAEEWESLPIEAKIIAYHFASNAEWASDGRF